MFADLSFAVSITAPIFCIIGLGIVFKRIHWMTEDFARTGSELVFRVTLPCLLFVKLVETDFQTVFPLQLVSYAVISTTLVFLILDFFCARLVLESSDRGVFVQGAFRGNMGIIGLAYCLSAFGDAVIATASVYLAVMTTLYNVLAVITLTRHQGDSLKQGMLWPVFKGILKNPLILAIFAGVVLSLLAVPIPKIVLETGSYFAAMTLPLALLCAGASIRLREFQASPVLYWATGSKLFLVPLAITLGGVLFGLRSESLGVLFLMSVAPTAAASYPMAQAMGANYHLAAAIIAATSLGSIVSSTLGLFLLRLLELI